ncbi:hypothetical protein DV736_g6080, partial [Chaetothyriales sp. CBS 134916]
MTNLDDDSFVPQPLTRAAKSETWFNRFVPLRHLSPSRAPTRPALNDAQSQVLLDDARNKFCSAITGSTVDTVDTIRYSDLWKWYFSYLEFRARAAWALCASVLVGLTIMSDPDDNLARQSLYKSFAIVAECLHEDADVGFVSIMGKMKADALICDNASSDDIITYGFQVVGWLSSMWDPAPDPDLTILQLRSRQYQKAARRKTVCSRTRLTVSEARHQTVRRVASRLGGTIAVPSISTDDHSLLNLDLELGSISTSYLSYHSLSDLLKVKIVWTDTLAEHLNFDFRSKSLSIFKHPSICLLMIRRDGDTIFSRIFEAEHKEKSESEQECFSEYLGHGDYLLEIILSYQLIFALHRDSRKLIKDKLSRSAPFGELDGCDVDPLLKILCTLPPDSNEVHKLYTQLELEQYGNEISISDVPFLAKKLLYLESVKATIEFLAKLPLYETEKPYLLLPSEHQGLDPDEIRLNNLEFEHHDDVIIKDMRQTKELSVDCCGFEFYPHSSAISSFHDAGDIEEYRVETQHLLASRFGAEKVMTYEIRLRRNQDFNRKKFDVYDKLLEEGPAKGAHNDVTYTSGPNIIRRYLSVEDQARFLRHGYRIRIFNTWRPLNTVLEDRPLAFCDARTIIPGDLVAADRILPDRVGEIYYLYHNPQQLWYWLEKQRNNEPFIFLMYDTHSRGVCPHVSFDNPNKATNAEPRKSVETRSIVITADAPDEYLRRYPLAQPYSSCRTISLTMAASKKQVPQLGAANTFFQDVDIKGYPAVQQKEQPWTKYIAATEGSKKPQQSDRMVVLCSLRHDYGSSGLGGS